MNNVYPEGGGEFIHPSNFFIPLFYINSSIPPMPYTQLNLRYIVSPLKGQIKKLKGQVDES